MGFFGNKTGGPDKPVSFHELGGGGGVQTPQTEQKVSLDTDTKSILQEAARNARKSIFKSTGTQPEKQSDVPAE